jgi:hypothetical protein
VPLLTLTVTHLRLGIDPALIAVVHGVRQGRARAGRGPHGNGVAWDAGGVACPHGPVALDAVHRAAGGLALLLLGQRPARQPVVKRLWRTDAPVLTFARGCFLQSMGWHPTYGLDDLAGAGGGPHDHCVDAIALGVARPGRPAAGHAVDLPGEMTSALESDCHTPCITSHQP